MSETAISDARVEALAGVIRADLRARTHMPSVMTIGGGVGISEYDLAAAILASPAMRSLLAEERARALREAADDDVWEYEGDVTRPAVRRFLRHIADREQS